MSYCRKCGKPLSNPKSVKEGIGPVCAKKEAIEEEREYHSILDSLKGEQENNDYPSLQDYLNQLEERTCSCGANIIDGKIEHYAHNGGEPLKGWKEKQWLFLICPKCKIEWSIWKLLPKEKPQEATII